MNLFILFSFILLSLFCSILLLKSKNIYGGNDTQFHFKRIMEVIVSFNHLTLPDFSFNYFHGSGIMILYPYFNFLLIALLSIFIKTKVLLIYGYFILNTFITFVISYVSSKNYIKLYSTSYIFAVIYGTSNIFLSYNLIVNDFGIAETFILLPLIVFGFLELIQNKGWIELTIGMSLLSMSHILNLIIISAFLLLWFILNITYLNRYVIYKLFKSIFLFLIISSIVWLPFIYFYITNLHNINMPFVKQLTTIDLKQFMSGIYGGKSIETIGFFPIISVFVFPMFYKRFNKYDKQMYYLSLLIIVMVLFFPWKMITSNELFKIFNQIQGTYRFLIIPQILLVFIFSLIITKFIKASYIKIICNCLIIILTMLLQLIIGQYSFIKSCSNYINLYSYLNDHNNVINYYDRPFYKFNNNNQFNKLVNAYQSSNDDYIPRSSLHVSKYVNKNLGLYNNHYRIIVKHVGYNQFDFINKKNIYKLYLPIYVYNKEKLHVYLNGKEVNNYTNKNGLLAVNNIQHNMKLNNKIYIKPFPNLYRIIGTVLSILGWLFVLCIIIKRKFIH